MPNHTLVRALCTVPALALAVGLAACAGGRVNNVFIGGSYDPRTLDYAASKGSFHTRVVGNPFKGDKARLDQTVVGSMYGAHSGQRVRFSTERDPNNSSPYFVVVMFNPGPGISVRKLCGNPEQPTAGGAETVRVMMVLCAGGDYENYVNGQMAAASGPDDPALRALIRQMTAQLFPPKNPDPQGGLDFDI